MTQGAMEEAALYEEAAVRTYGDDAFCPVCGCVGEKIGHDYAYDILWCTNPDCCAEWEAVSLLKRGL